MNRPSDPRNGSTPPTRATAPGIALTVVLGLLFVVYVAGARAAEPGIAARPDLEILRAWIAGGDPSKLTDVPGHFTKPGYLLFLRAIVPRGGSTTEELRRVLLVNALWTWMAIAVLCAVLWRRRRPVVALSIAVISLLFVGFRDATDWVASEPLAVGFSFLVGAVLLALPNGSRIGAAALGAGCAFFLLIRPNVSYVLLLVAVATFASGGRSGWISIATLLMGFAAGLGLLWLAARVTRLPADPRTMTASKTLFYGTHDYAWPPGDASGWPSGRTPEETSRGEREAARDRWRVFFSRFGPDERRSLLWRLTHPVLSIEQLPARWDHPVYLAASRSLRRWWWVGAVLAASAAAACAITARGRWRFVPALLFTAIAGQGLLFGAETRHALPLWPLVFLGLVLTLSTIRLTWGATAVAAATALVLVAIAWKVPDAVASDYAVTRELDDVIRQHVPSSGFRESGGRTVHLRVLAAPRTVGLEIRGNGELLFRRPPGDRAPYPAFHTLWLTGPALKRAQREGLRLEIRVLGEETGKGFLYFPVVPDPFGPVAELNGSRRLPSGFGGITTGAFPVWTHLGGD